jgi:beta-lactamase regulating signal transducer with metallopeptidase domain
MNALAWTLIHFVWEGGIIVAALALVLRFTRTASARYLISCGAMMLMLASAAATFAVLSGNRNATQPIASVHQTSVPAIASSPVAAELKQRGQLSDYLPWLVYLWIGGVLALSLRTGAGFVVAQRLKRRQSAPLPPIWEERFHRLAQRLEISRTVRACESAIAEVPAVVGWLRPVVLVPASALMGLPAPEIEALLAHELAHIRRHDYLVNLLQTAIETLLFYHPAVWWTSQQIRAERENCCDDLAVAACGDVLTYARALTRLDQMRPGAPKIAMASNGGSLLARIRRLVRPQEGVRSSSGDWITGLAILLSATAIYAAGYVPSPQVKYFRPQIVLAAAPQKPEPIGPRVKQQIELEDQDTGQADSMVTKELALLDDQAEQSASSAPASGFLDGLAAEGYKNLSVDDLISFKIHGVTPEYIRSVKAAGFQPTPDDLVSMRIHGVETSQIAGFKAAGIDKLTIDDLVSLRIHGATPEFVQAISAAGYSKIDADDVVSLRIHGVTPEFAKEVKSLGLGDPSLDDLVSMRIHGVTPEFIHEVQKRGFKDLTVEKIVDLKRFNIF